MNVFIHGYGTNIYSPIQRPLGIEKGFHSLKHEECKAFDWSLPFQFGILQAVDPRAVASVYQNERDLTFDRNIHDRLGDFLLKHNPQVIFAHSLGCELLLQYLVSNQLPESVRRIVWMQADVDHDSCLQLDSPVEFFNVYCPWDPAMIVSSLYHRKIRAGLTGLRYRRVKNILLPATRLPNLHTSCLHDKKIKMFVK